MQIYVVQLDGDPIPWQRPGVFRGRFYDKQKSEKSVVKELARKQYPFDPIDGFAARVDCEYVFPIPESWSKVIKEKAMKGLVRHKTKPDRDNLEKFYFDALKDVIWADDRLLDSGYVLKRYCEEGERPFVKFTIWVDD